MGVAIALGVAGIAGGIMGSMGQQSQAEAQYMANKIEVERNNFQQSLKNDKANFATAKANAMRRWNNLSIAKAATQNYAEQRRVNRLNWKANIHNTAQKQVQFMAALDSEATGRGLRGGTADAMQRQADATFMQERKNLTTARMQEDASAKAMYEAALAKRDFMSQGQANIFMPGSTGVAPGNGNLNMLAGILGGASSGLSAGIGAQSGLKELGFTGPLLGA